MADFDDEEWGDFDAFNGGINDQGNNITTTTTTTAANTTTNTNTNTTADVNNGADDNDFGDDEVGEILAMLIKQMLTT